MKDKQINAYIELITKLSEISDLSEILNSNVAFSIKKYNNLNCVIVKNFKKTIKIIVKNE
jgi:hypothetical protein